MGKIKHGGCGTPLYNVWKTMRQRCNNPKNQDYKWYGACGVSVCKEWNDFAKFREWSLANGYCSGMTIDRVDGSAGYCPDNCAWTTIQEQQKNKRNVLQFSYLGKEYTVESFCKAFKITPQAFHDRRRRNWSLEEIVTIPKAPPGGYRAKGVHAYHG